MSRMIYHYYELWKENAPFEPLDHCKYAYATSEMNYYFTIERINDLIFFKEVLDEYISWQE